ncbi:hypothetical protein SAMN04488239_102449 [Ruegeria marina]|uniref:Uncharacterized protein n=2 Tax=Ruegeria marina TaxID=639004 RepID=A0A1G6MC45_9RHOB|nr:hypothetical protein SAMN04488239_102449 [Ruegeria marina]
MPEGQAVSDHGERGGKSILAHHGLIPRHSRFPSRARLRGWQFWHDNRDGKSRGFSGGVHALILNREVRTIWGAIEGSAAARDNAAQKAGEAETGDRGQPGLPSIQDEEFNRHFEAVDFASEWHASEADGDILEP